MKAQLARESSTEVEKVVELKLQSLMVNSGETIFKLDCLNAKTKIKSIIFVFED